MCRQFHILTAVVLAITLLCAKSACAGAESDAANLISDLLGPRSHISETKVSGRVISIPRMMQRFYRGRKYMPAWSYSGGTYAEVYELIDAIDTSYQDGLNPKDYPRDEMLTLIEAQKSALEAGEAPNPSVMADLDLLATNTFLSLGYHLLAGRIFPEITDGEWSDNIWEADLDDVLTESLAAGNIAGTIKSLAPPNEDYILLRDALANYREIAAAGGWQVVPYGGSMRLGDRSSRVAVLRERLLISGDLDYDDAASDKTLFDEPLERAVLLFQKRHGLEPDGVVGPNTLAAINVPVSKRIEQLELNMERWRWLPEYLGDRYIFVNTAAFELKVVEFGTAVMKMKIVVGKPYWHTPSFSAKMTYLIVNPTWYVPTSIAIEEILPGVLENPDYIAKNGFKIVSGGNGTATTIDPSSIDWSEVTEDSLGFRIFQPPGPTNPLGRIKFMFPNRFSVYLHDTSSKNLFNRTVRTFSHGCIRIEKPIELAQYLVPGEDFKALIEKGEEVKVTLPDPIMVHSLYWTAWVDRDGTVNFREDIYGRDEALLELLSYGPMTP